MSKPYYTIKDIENKAKASPRNTFKGRANEAILKIGKDFGIDYETRKVKTKRQTEEYAFTGNEQELLSALLSVSKHRPLSHGNKKFSNISVIETFKYHTALIDEINNIPEPLKSKIVQDDRYQFADETQTSMQNIHSLVDKLEFQFYMSPAKIGVELLHIIEDFMENLVEENLKLYGEFEKERANEHFEKLGIIPQKEQLEQQIKKQFEEKMEVLTTGRDPEVHLLDNLIGSCLRESFYESNN